MYEKDKKPLKLVVILFIAATILTIYYTINIRELDICVTNLIDLQKIISNTNLIQ